MNTEYTENTRNIIYYYIHTLHDRRFSFALKNGNKTHVNTLRIIYGMYGNILLMDKGTFNNMILKMKNDVLYYS